MSDNFKRNRKSSDGSPVAGRPRMAVEPSKPLETSSRNPLQKSEQRFRSLVEMTSDWLWEVDRNGVYTYSSPKVKDLLGYEPDEVLGKMPFEFMPPDEAERVAAYFKDTVAARRSFAGLENVNLHKDGHQVVLESSGVPFFDAAGNLMGYRGIDRDITDRKQAELALRKSEEQYRLLVQSANSIILRMDTRGNITFLNEFGQRFFGFSEEEILGKSAVGTIVPETETTGRNLAAMIQDIGKHPEKYVNNENENMRRNGERVWVAWTNKPIYSENGSIVETLCIGNDITARKHAEEALRESEERYRLHFENVSDVVYSTDMQFRITSISPSVETYLGYRPEEMIGKTIAELNVVAPEYLGQAIERSASVLSGRKGGPTEYEFIAKDGSRKWGEITGAPLLKNGEVVAMVAVARDITERKHAESALRKSEERYRTLVDSSLTGIFVVQDGYIQFVNKQFVHMSGYTEEELIGMRYLDLIHPDDRKFARQAATLRLEERENAGRFQLRATTKTGDTLWVETFGTRIDYQGKPAILANLIDITEQKVAEERLQEAHRKLLELEALKEDLINMVAHDMKNPVANTMLGLEMIEVAPHGHLSDQQREYLRIARQNQFKLSEMIVNLLETSKLESGEMQLNKVSFDLADLVDRTVKRHSAIIESEENVVRTEIAPEARRIIADENLLERVLSNLLSNAVRHSYPTGEITIQAVPASQNRGVTISVRDHGEGIPKKYHQRIFEKFRQPDEPKNQRRADTGLGLAFCKMAVEAHGGTIAVESKPGEGSCFTVTLTDALPDEPH
jgi:two-component system sensor histidine kinase/response regulator